MDQVRGSKIFSKFDMKSSYNQIRIKEGHEYLTTFITHRGPFQSNVLGFGQMNAPPFFQRFVDDHIYRRPELVLHLVGYIDDANTHNANTPDHIWTNCHFFQRCRETGIYLNPKKCEFHKEKIDFLGVELSEKGFEMESVKTQAIHDWQRPRYVRGVREFIGFCNFYRRFIKGFAEIARPLHNLTRVDHKWQWGPLQQTSFQKLKNTVASTPVLIHANLDKPFRIETDASAYAYGAVLSQKSQDSRYHPVGFFSKSMTPPERNYGISDWEALAVVRALQHWRHLLEGMSTPIEILTDHRNLEYFTKPKVLNRRQLRWMELLNQYNYHIIYRPGNQNGAADALSRRAELTPTDPPEELPQTMIPAHRLIAEISLAPTLLSDDQIHDLIRATLFDKLPPKVEVINGLPYYNERIYVPAQSDARKHVMALYHDSPIAGHLGQSGTLDLIWRQYWWPHMATTIAEYIQTCNPCSQNKHPNQRPPGALQVLPTPEGPWEWTQSDHITGLPRSRGFNAIYVVMDRLTKMAHLIPTTDRANAEDLAQLHLTNVWRLHGVPRIHNTDKGPLFTTEYT
jgi:hypothetical protein